MPQRFKVHDGAYPHFITCTVIHWIPVFCRDDYFAILADSLIYCATHKGLQIHGFVLMPNHWHALCSQIEGRLTDVMRDLKTYTSKGLAKKLEEDGRSIWLTAMRRAAGETAGVKVWDDHFHPEQVHTEPFFRQKLEYMHNNPLRAGFVADPCSWKYSSAGFYYQQQESVVPITAIEW